MSVSAALAAATARLAASSDTPRLDAELLLAHSLGIEREQMLLGAAGGAVPPTYDGLLARRLSGEPIAYIIGRRAFWTIELEVGPDVLIPRPDSETLIEAALAHFGDQGPANILDLGTGSGALLLAALDQWPAARGLGVDRSEAALAIAGRNAARLGLADRASIRVGDWGDGLSERFDLILCNPPYVESGALLPRDVADFEPSEALFASADGLAEYRRLAPSIVALLAPGGIACIELGLGQADAVADMFAAQGLEAVRHRDLAGHTRCLALTQRPEVAG